MAGGGYATLCVAPAPQCLPVPASLDLVAAAAIPETFFTVWTNVFDRGRLQRGRDGALSRRHERHRHDRDPARRRARRHACLPPPDPTRSAAPARRSAREHAINYRTQDFVEAVQRLTDGRGVDLILDIVGGSYVARNLAALAIDGRLVQIGLMEGEPAPASISGACSGAG